jgi:hypothetical protein
MGNFPLSSGNMRAEVFIEEKGNALDNALLMRKN